MKKRLLSILIITIMAICPMWVSAYDKPIDTRKIPEDSYFKPYTEEGNPYVTHYAPWLRNFHMMSDEEATRLENEGGIGGEAYQMVRMLEISPKNSNLMYFMTNTSGIYKTEDGGEHWYYTGNNMAGHDAKGLLCDPIEENWVYASFAKDGFYRSKDAGESWELIIDDWDTRSGHRSNTIAADASGNIYFAATNGIYRLNRIDDSLELIYDMSSLQPKKENDDEAYRNKGPYWNDIDVSPDGRYIYASCLSNTSTDAKPGLYASDDYGKTWKLKLTNDYYSYDVSTLAIHPDDPKRIFFAASRTLMSTPPEGFNNPDTTSSLMLTDGNYALYESSDSGVSFCGKYMHRSEDNKSYLRINSLCFGPQDSNGVPLYYCVNYSNYPHRVSYNYDNTVEEISFQKLYSKTDNITTGTIYKNGGHGYLYQAFAPDTNIPGRVVFACDGIHEKKADGTFRRISGGVSGASVSDIAFDSNGKMFFCTTDYGSHTSDRVYEKNSDGGYAYPTFEEGVDDYFVMAEFAPWDDDHIIAATGENNGSNGYYAIRQSKNGGKTFADMEDDSKLAISEGFGNNQFITFSGNTIYTSYFTSYDKGETWHRNMLDEETPIYVLASHPDNPERMLGLIGKRDDSFVKYYSSDDGGKNWKLINGSANNQEISCVEFDLGDENTVWITKLWRFYKLDMTTGEMKLVSSYQGSTVTEFAQNPKNHDHMLVASRPNFIYTRTDAKLWETLDGGRSWHVVPGVWGGGFPNLEFSKTTDEVFICSMAGILIYDYNKFKYYCSVELLGEHESYLYTASRIDEAGKNVNYGKYIISPEYPFEERENRVFKGWIYKEKTYAPGEYIDLE